MGLDSARFGWSDMTTELKISFLSDRNLSAEVVKIRVIDFIEALGRTDFVEGYIDGVTTILSDAEIASATTTDDRMSLAPVLIFDDNSAVLEGLAKELHHHFFGLVATELSEISDDSWQRCWNQDFSPFETSRFFIVPLGYGAATPVGLERVELDVGDGAFGTGQHATTRAIIRILEDHLPDWAPGSMLDVGTGTGIYLIVAKKMGVASVVGTEVSQDLVELARVNCETSGVSAKVMLTEKIDFDTEYDLIVANILSPVLHELMQDMTSHLKLGGRLVIAGFISKEQPALIERASRCGLIIKKAIDENGWCALVLQR